MVSRRILLLEDKVILILKGSVALFWKKKLKYIKVPICMVTQFSGHDHDGHANLLL